MIGGRVNIPVNNVRFDVWRKISKSEEEQVACFGTKRMATTYVQEMSIMDHCGEDVFRIEKRVGMFEGGRIRKCS